MKGLEFAILHLGGDANDEALNLYGLNWGTVDNKHPQAVWLQTPSIGILVRHPEAGYLLYDTGNYLGNPEERLPEALRGDFAFDMTREDFIDRQLERLGLSVQDIRKIIISHGHYDHMGGVGFFSGTEAGRNVYISRAELEAALLESHRTPDGFGNAYFRGDFEFPDIQFRFAEEGEFLPGVELIHLGGHTRGTLGMVLHCTEHSYIFPSDALYTARNLGPPAVVPGLVADTRGFFRSVEKVSALQKAHNATIIYPHDQAQLKTLKLAPYFYR